MYNACSIGHKTGHSGQKSLSYHAHARMTSPYFNMCTFSHYFPFDYKSSNRSKYMSLKTRVNVACPVSRSCPPVLVLLYTCQLSILRQSGELIRYCEHIQRYVNEETFQRLYIIPNCQGKKICFCAFSRRLQASSVTQREQVYSVTTSLENSLPILNIRAKV